MAIRFDHNNNNSEWMEEMQMLFNKINNRSPFGVITFIGPILSHFKNVMRSGYLSSEPTKQDQIRSFLINKREFIGFVEIIIGPSESLFFVYENEPSTTFNLKNYLLVLATTHCNPTAICYCENKQDTQNTDTKEIKFLSAKSHDFGKELDSTGTKIISDALLSANIVSWMMIIYKYYCKHYQSSRECKWDKSYFRHN